ncbi:MAG: signal peptidase I [Candidatus Dormibacteria bacterium]
MERAGSNRHQEAREQQGNTSVGNARVTLPEELHDLVRDVVADLESATGDLGVGGPPPPPRAPRQERRRTPQAAVLRLPSPGQPPPRSSPGAAAGLDPGSPALEPAPRRRAFLARVAVASTVPHMPLPVRTRRVQVACRRASPLDAARMSRMLRVAVPSLPVTSASPIAAPAWLTAAAPPAAAPALDPPAEGAAVVLAGRIATAPPADPVPAAPAAPVVLPPMATVALSIAAEGRPLWRSTLGHVTNLLIAAALGLVGIFCCIVVGLVVTGHHLEEVVTGSMQPTIPIGSLVVTEQLPAGQLQVGDIMVFPNPNDPKLTIVHRIVWLSHDQSGDVLARTKGDYNALPDQWTIKRQASADADRVVFILPGAGTAAGYLQTIGFWGLIALLVGVIGYYGIRKVRQILTESDADAAAAGASEPLS